MTLQEWRESNPLRAWRLKTGTKAARIAERLDVSRVSVMHWEKGDKTPAPLRMAAIAKMIGMPDCRRRWLHWLADRPEEAA